MLLDETACHAAIEAKDRRYDGLFFIGVTSTGIYCRCVCPARTPKRENRTFHLSAAAAEKAGFRPCLICRPECAPGAAPIDSAQRLAHDAVKRIEAGALEEQGLEELADDLGVTSRHLRRVMLRVFGAAPVEIAQTHRLLTAKRLLKETELGMTEIAFASGFQSVRRFNALFQERYSMPPSRVRGRGKAKGGGLSFALTPRGAYDPAAPLAHAFARAIANAESFAGKSWTRTFAIGAHSGWLKLDFAGVAPTLTLSDGLLPAFRALIAAARGALDLDVDLAAIDAHFASDPALDVGKSQSPRLPGALDPFEVAVRAVLGQQVTVKAATTLAARLTERFGAPIETDIDGLNRLFPTPARIADAGIDAIAKLGMPGARAAALHALASAVADNKLKLARGAIAAGRAGLSSIPGIGPWTVEYVALRGLGDPDAFPLGDTGLRDGFTAGGDLKRACEAWRPWRGYAAARLWRRAQMNLEKKNLERPRK
ncbi:MAG: DNA-3-methyladenine glycosylase 2 family protein [Hyphomonadaceae bacterium]|nr:DNA-3-methyladenine glycosylase 2 family protein [Hyphomonadaceae bacterium]